MFRVFSAWGKRRSHKLRGKSLSTLQRIAMKWSMKVWMAFFCMVVVVIVWWDELVGHLVGFDCVLEVVRALVVKNVLLGGDAGGMEPVKEGLECMDHLTGGSVLYRFDKDDIAVTLGEYHDILIAFL